MSSGAIGEKSNAQRILITFIFLNGDPSVKEELHVVADALLNS
jgi:hypothetical protein